MKLLLDEIYFLPKKQRFKTISCRKTSKIKDMKEKVRYPTHRNTLFHKDTIDYTLQKTASFFFFLPDFRANPDKENYKEPS